eukprot:maker-scaffold301_size216225-snap-gene-0.19 protein:Tk06226 transcript:maker-scaffold301_size216225-snap-gene-0.19-mRNA-1 annotation:"tyramine octopamine receptor-like"
MSEVSFGNKSFPPSGLDGNFYYSPLFGIFLALPEWEALLAIVSTTIIILGTIVGNILVIMSVFTHTPLKITPNFFIVSLAAADLTVSMCVLPLNVAYMVVGRWIFGSILCKMWLTSDVLCCTASILNLCAIALDRYYALHDPIKHAQRRSVRNVLAKVLVVWVMSMGICFPPLFGWNDWPDAFTPDTPCRLTEEKGYVIYSAMGSFYIPLGIIMFVYLKIYQNTRLRLRSRAKAAHVTSLHHPPSEHCPTQKRSLQLEHKQPVGGARARLKVTLQEQVELVNGHPIYSEVAIGASAIVDPAQGQQGSTSGPKRVATVRTHILAKVKQKHSKMYQKSFKNRGSLRSKTGSVRPEEETSTLDEPDHLLASADCLKHSKCDQGTQVTKSSFQRAPSTAVEAPGPDLPSSTPDNTVYRFINEKAKISLAKERKAARTMTVIVTTFIVCWLPFFLMYVITPFCSICAPPSPKVVQVITWLGYVNSTLNPIIYTIFNLDFRIAFSRIMTDLLSSGAIIMASMPTGLQNSIERIYCEFADLPDEVMLDIFEELGRTSLRTLITVSQVSRRCHRLACQVLGRNNWSERLFALANPDARREVSRALVDNSSSLEEPPYPLFMLRLGGFYAPRHREPCLEPLASLSLKETMMKLTGTWPQITRVRINGELVLLGTDMGMVLVWTFAPDRTGATRLPHPLDIWYGNHGAALTHLDVMLSTDGYTPTPERPPWAVPTDFDVVVSANAMGRLCIHWLLGDENSTWGYRVIHMIDLSTNREPILALNTIGYTLMVATGQRIIIWQVYTEEDRLNVTVERTVNHPHIGAGMWPGSADMGELVYIDTTGRIRCLIRDRVPWGESDDQGTVEPQPWNFTDLLTSSAFLDCQIAVPYNKIFLALDPTNDRFILALRSNQARIYSPFPFIHTYVTAFKYKINTLFLGTANGRVFMYEIARTSELLALRLNCPTCVLFCPEPEPVVHIDVEFVDDATRVAVSQADQLNIFEWFDE